MAFVARTFGRLCLLQRQLPLMQQRAAQASSNTNMAYEEMQKYWEKNSKLQRPISPHVTIYKPHLAMVSSITFRITGVAMQAVVTGVPLCLLALPGDFTHYLELVKSMSLGPAFITTCKLVLAFPMIYHFFNGIRHLAWDAGLGFGVKTLYNTGVVVWILTAIFTVYFAVFY